MRRLVGFLFGSTMLSVMATVASAQALPYKPVPVTSTDGLHIAAQEWGNPAGSEIVFVHGFAQSHLSWMKQVTAPELAGFHIVTYDLRGHGDSDMPTDRAAYQSPDLYADDLKAVMDAAQLKHPVVVVWSWGGRVIAWYLQKYGSDRLAGINFVDATTVVNAKFFGAGVVAGAYGSDLQSNIDYTTNLLRACFETQPDEADFQNMVAFNMVVTAQTRKNMTGVKFDAASLWPTVHIPVLVTHGGKDRVNLPAMGEYTAQTIPGAKLSIYPGSGHSPFWEQPSRYNGELAEFVKSVQK